MATPESKRGPVRLYAFKLGGKVPFPYPHIAVPPVPKPPEQKANKDVIKKGAKLYVSFYCEGCHSPEIDGSAAWVEDGAIPDLRYAPSQVHKDWYTIVMGGSHWGQRNARHGRSSQVCVSNFTHDGCGCRRHHAYVIDQAWKAYRGEQQQAPHSKRESY